MNVKRTPIASAVALALAAVAAVTGPKVAIIVGATHGATASYRSYADQVYAEALSAGYRGYPFQTYSSASGRVCCLVGRSVWAVLRANVNW